MHVLRTATKPTAAPYMKKLALAVFESMQLLHIGLPSAFIK